MQIKNYTKNQDFLQANGWYHAANGWWHLDLGREPQYSGGLTIKKALETMENWNDPRRNTKNKR